MKKLDQFILKSFVGPFFAVLVVVVFILMLQFLWVYIDELVGKGLGLKVILEFMGWGGCTMLPLALPLATLLASVMTLGNMSENSELIAMKAAGLSIGRVMIPLMTASVFISIGTFFAVNNLVPVAYNKIYNLRDDIKHTNEEINIPTGTFYDGIDGYILRVSEKNDKTKMMYGVMVYDHTGSKGNTSVAIADSAIMKMSKNKDYLTFKLYSGVNYQETNDISRKDTSLQLQTIDFTSEEMVIQLKNYAFHKSSEDKFGDQAKAMKLRQLNHGLDSVGRERDSIALGQLEVFIKSKSLRFSNQLDTSSNFNGTSLYDLGRYGAWKNSKTAENAYREAAGKSKETANLLLSNNNELYTYDWTLDRVKVERLKKFAEALMCLILFFIGAPLGAFNSRKGGGMGVSIIIAVLFFVLYWVVDITGTKLARDGAVTAAAGAFVSSIVLAPIGAYLSWKAMNDSSMFGGEDLGTKWKKFKSRLAALFKKTKIVYMGTPDFALAPLEALIRERYKVVGVVTVADKPSGRGLKMNESAVKKFAVEHNIPVLQPLRLKDPEFLQQLAALKADLFIVVAFRMLPEEVWTMPPLGTFNLHAALLPQYRGAAPINWAIINGEKMTGVTTFMIDKDIDTGGIILRQECRISEDDTAGDIHDKLMSLGADLVLQTTRGIVEKIVETRVQRSFIQGSEVLKPAPKLTKELCGIDWNDSTKNIHNLIRGLSPYPTAYTTIEGASLGKPVQLKIFAADRVEGAEFETLAGIAPDRHIGSGAAEETVDTATEDIWSKTVGPYAGGIARVAASGVAGDACDSAGADASGNAVIRSAHPAGTILSDGKSYLAICTLDGAIFLKDVQLAGKKRMDVKTFLTGFRNPGEYKALSGTSRAEMARLQAM